MVQYQENTCWRERSWSKRTVGRSVNRSRWSFVCFLFCAREVPASTPVRVLHVEYLCVAKISLQLDKCMFYSFSGRFSRKEMKFLSLQIAAPAKIQDGYGVNVARDLSWDSKTSKPQKSPKPFHSLCTHVLSTMPNPNA